MPPSPATCSLESLWFYYDDDDELQCTCVDEIDDEDECQDYGARWPSAS